MLFLEPSYNKDLEIVAFEKNKIIGPGLLSEVKIVNANLEFVGLALAPLAVLPSFQKNKVGDSLIHELENRAIKLNHLFVSILGDPNYYTKFGYQAASRYNIKAPFDIPDEVFMIKPLVTDGLKGVFGTIKYPKAFEQ